MDKDICISDINLEIKYSFESDIAYYEPKEESK